MTEIVVLLIVAPLAAFMWLLAVVLGLLVWKDLKRDR